MSIDVSSMVWAGSKHSGAELLMLLAIAERADPSGWAWPSVTDLAARCRTTVRHANRLLAALRNGGELEIHLNQGPKGKNRYRVRVEVLTPKSPPTQASPLTTTSSPDPGVTLTPRSPTPDTQVPQPLTPRSDEPSLNLQEPSVARRRAAHGFDASLINLPEWLPRESWLAWVADRKERRKPITQRAADAQIKALDGYRTEGHSPAAVIANSIAAGYQGLFPPKQVGGTHQQGRRSGGDLLDCDHVFGGAHGRA